MWSWEPGKPAIRVVLASQLHITDNFTWFGRQEGAEVGYNRRYRGKRSYDPLLCVEANSAFLWDVELRRGDAGTWAGSEELLACCFLSTPSDIRELRVRADAGFGYGPVLEMLEVRFAQYSVVARMILSLKRALRVLRYEPMNSSWEIAEFEHHVQGWPDARRCIVARRKIEESDPAPTLFTLERYAYRAWHTNLPLTPGGFGASTMAVPEWSDASGKFVRAMR